MLGLEPRLGHSSVSAEIASSKSWSVNAHSRPGRKLTKPLDREFPFARSSQLSYTPTTFRGFALPLCNADFQFFIPVLDVE